MFTSSILTSKPKKGHTILRYTEWSSINEQKQNSDETWTLELSLYCSLSLLGSSEFWTEMLAH